LVEHGSPVSVQVLGSVRGFQGVANKRIDYNLMYTIDGSSSSVGTSVNTDGSSNFYFSFAPILLMQGKTLSFTVTIVSVVSDYTCYLNLDTQSISYPSSGFANVSSAIFSSVVLTTCAASGSGGITTTPQSGVSSINTTGLNPESFVPGTTANIDFTSSVGNGISSYLGVSNNSILVDICFDAANRPQLCIVFLPDAASSTSGANALVCSRAGQSITIPISVSSISRSNSTNSSTASNITYLSSASTATSSTIPFFLILPEFNSPLSELASIGKKIILSIPTYGAVIIGVIFVIFVIILYLLFRRYTPNAKIRFIIMFFLNWLLVSADFSFLAFLNSSRKPLVDSLGCSQENPLASNALLLLLLGVVLTVVAAVFGWYVSFKLMWHSCANHSLGYYGASRDLMTGKPISRSHHQFTRFKLKHKVAIAVVCLSCGLIGPSNVRFLASRFCGSAAFKCTFPKAVDSRIDIWDLILVLGYNLPFASLNIAASVQLHGWTWQIIASLVLQTIVILLKTVKLTYPVCVKHLECAKKLKECHKKFDKCVKKSPAAPRVVPSGAIEQIAAVDGVTPALNPTSKRDKFRRMANLARKANTAHSQISPVASAPGASVEPPSHGSSVISSSDSDSGSNSGSDSGSSNSESKSERLEIASNPAVSPTTDSSPPIVLPHESSDCSQVTPIAPSESGQSAKVLPCGS
jgi:hypothetical protein